MKRSRFTQEQIIGVLEEHQAGAAAADLCRKHGISDATFYKWRSKYGGMEVSDARKLKGLEEVSRKRFAFRRERPAEEAAGGVDAGRVDAAGDAGKKLVTPGLRRSAVTWALQQRGYSQRRACKLVGIEPKTCRYVPRRPDDGAVRTRLRALAGERRRFGYRRLHILLARDGLRLNHKRLFRLYREERLGVRKLAETRSVCGWSGRKRALGTRSPMALPEAANQRWSLDFVSDALASGRRFRVLAVVDDFTRECLGLVADTSLSGLLAEIPSGFAAGSGVSWTGSPSGAAVVLRSLSATTARSLRRTPSCAGRRSRVWHGTTSRRASRSRTGSWRASTAGSGTSA